MILLHGVFRKICNSVHHTQSLRALSECKMVPCAHCKYAYIVLCSYSGCALLHEITGVTSIALTFTRALCANSVYCHVLCIVCILWGTSTEGLHRYRVVPQI